MFVSLHDFQSRQIVVLVTLNNQLFCVRSFRVIMWFTLHDWVLTGWGSHTTKLKARRNPQQDSLVSKSHFVRKNKQEVTQEILRTQLHQVFFHAAQQNYQCGKVWSFNSVQVQQHTTTTVYHA